EREHHHPRAAARRIRVDAGPGRLRSPANRSERTHGVIALPLLAAALACVYVAPPADNRALEAAGIERVCTEADPAGREALPTPGTAPRAGLASPTRAPWIVASGWRVVRQPGRKYVYDVPSGKAALAAAEAFAYGADAALKIDASDVRPLGEMLRFLQALPSRSLPLESEIGLVD